MEINKTNVDILIVDDSPTQIMQLEYTLEKHQYTVVSAKDGKNALEILKQFKPMVVISDIVMPEMDGYELCQKIKNLELTEEIPVILLTALSNPEDVIKGLECGADNFITKSCSEDYLIKQIEQIIFNYRQFPNERLKVGVEIMFGGERRFINTSQQQMLTLLLSTYEAAVSKNKELLEAQEELQVINEHLEDLVEERTLKLQKNEKKFLDLYNNTPSMFISVEFQTGKVVECNDTFLRKTGFTRSEVIDEQFLKFYHPNSIEKAKNNFIIFNETGEIQNSELDLITVNGERLPVLINSSAVRDENNVILNSRTVFQDITEIKLVQAELMRSEEQYKSVTDSAIDSIISIDSDGIIIGWNKGAAKTFGYQEHEMIGQSISSIIPSGYKELHFSGLLRLRDGGSPHVIGQMVELQGVRKNGEIFPVELSLSQWHTQKGTNFTGIIRDITERKLVEKDLLLAKKKAEESDNLKSAFLANMSHEIRTPMNAILGFSELLKDDDDDQTDNKLIYIDAIDIATHQLLNIITNIVEISKIESGNEVPQYTEFNLKALLDETFVIFNQEAEKKNLKLSINNNCPANPSNIKSDPVKLQQILNNIIGNAIKFTLNGYINVEIYLKENQLHFSVMDTGIGIDASFHDAIFSRFRQVEISHTRRFGGTGLGLSLAKSYVEMLGGTIRVDSTLDVGSTFTFTLPYIPIIIQAEIIPKEKKKETLNSWNDNTILVAEDEDVNMFYLETILKPTGIKILTASNGLEAIEQCKNNSNISVVLMDIKMPEMDGLTATSIIKTFWNNLPIIATTAFALSSDKKKCLDAGCDDYLPKPIMKNQLFSMISKYVS